MDDMMDFKVSLDGVVTLDYKAFREHIENAYLEGYRDCQLDNDCDRLEEQAKQGWESSVTRCTTWVEVATLQPAVETKPRSNVHIFPFDNNLLSNAKN
ncbi:hypothetical protein RCJ22_24740 [Vibrio sp. FNV 38]|nr:hypothetical protein [Vibrio sp. FNV 38]